MSPRCQIFLAVVNNPGDLTHVDETHLEALRHRIGQKNHFERDNRKTDKQEPYEIKKALRYFVTLFWATSIVFVVLVLVRLLTTPYDSPCISRRCEGDKIEPHYLTAIITYALITFVYLHQ